MMGYGYVRRGALLLAALVAAAVADERSALAQSSGTWNVDANGGWLNSANWLSGAIPNARGAVANFNLNITTTRTVTLGLGETATAGQLIFSDNGGAGSGWIISGPGQLVLSNTISQPQITASTGVTISSVIAGTQGLRKLGAGTLVLSGANVFTGNTSIEAGTLQIGDGGTTGNLTGVVTMTFGSTLAINRSDNYTFTHSIFGGGSIRKMGAGTTTINDSGFFFDGNLSIEGGVLQTNVSAFSFSSNLALSGGGVLQTQGNFDRSVGDGDGQVFWGGSGGFSAANSTLTVNLGGAAAARTWGQVNFISGSDALVFGSESSAARTVFLNPLNLGGAARTIRVNDNASSSADVTELSGGLSNGGLIKDGLGTLVLTASNNSYTGSTTILAGTLQVGSGFTSSMITGTVFNSGTLAFNMSTTATFAGNVTGNGRLVQTNTIGTLVLTGTNTHTGQTEIAAGRLVAQGAASLSGANLLFSSTGTSGTLLTNGTFTRSIGTGAGQVQWAGSGGFGNNSTAGVLTVNLGGAGQQVTWGSGNFVPFGSALIFTAGTVNSLTASTRFVNPIDLNGGVGNISVTNSGAGGGFVEFTGAISNGGLTKSGNSLLVLSGANTYGGGTTILGGVLRADEGTTLPTTGLLTLSGGVLETRGQFTRSLGTGSGQLNWRAGGFAALGADLTVNIGGAGQELVWGSAEFNPSSLTFGSGSNDHQVRLVNGIDLGGATRTALFLGNPTEFTGVIRNGGLQKTGAMLVLSAANTYTGGTTLAGALRAVDGVGLPTAGNLRFAGGTLESSGMFTRAVGTGSGQVSWEGNGGFSAYDGDLTVNLGGAGGTLVWGQGGFTAGELWLGTSEADSKTTLVNGLDLAGGARILRMNASHATDSDSYEISGAISNGSLSVEANGGDRDALLILSGANSYSQINLGFLSEVRATEGVGLPTLANLNLVAGVFESSGSFTRSLGTGAGQVQFSGGGGGFAAYGGQMTVNLGGAGQQLTWGQGSFIPAGRLYLGGAHADSKLLWQNGLNLAGGQQSIEVADNPNSAGDFAEVAASITNGNLRKNGEGLLILSGVNSYGNVSIEGGAVRAVDGVGLPTASTISFGGGVWESSGEATFTRPLSGPGNVSWNFDGGFSASGGNLLVNLGGTGGTLTWNSGGFVDTGRTLMFSSRFADSKVTFANGIDLNGAVRTIQADENVFATTDLAEISGVVSNGGLLKTGAGMLVLSNTNTYAMGTTVSAGTLRAANNSALGSGTVIVQSGARLDVATGVNIVNTITLSGGTISGGGSITSAIVVGAGSTISPGNSPGTFTTGTETWATGGSYNWEINDVDAGAGIDPGWDLIHITGQLNITATSGGKFNINVLSLDLGNSAGPVHDFNPFGAYSWTIAQADGGVLGFDSSAFNINATNFLNSHPGVFSVILVGDEFRLNYNGTAIPEPTSVCLAAIAGLAGAAYRRRRRTKNLPPEAAAAVLPGAGVEVG